MAKLKTKRGELTPADLASYGIPPKQPEGPKLVKGQEPETPWMERLQSQSPCP